MNQNIRIPDTSSHVLKVRTLESKEMERLQNSKLQELGIDPYEYDTDAEYTEEEQELIDRAIKLIIKNEEVPKELADRVKTITGCKKE